MKLADNKLALLQGGKDHAAARYIFTDIPRINRAVFHPADDALLEYLTDDNDVIEPQWYMPVLPMILVNGADGIGTGASGSLWKKGFLRVDFVMC